MQNTDNPENSFSNRRQQDLDLFHKWKRTQDPYDLSNLMDQLGPLMTTEVNRAGGTLPRSAFSAEAKHWTLHALNTYDPDKGAALGTHVHNWLQKVRRQNKKFQNAVRLPENLQDAYKNWNNATVHLRDKLQRDPTDEELADHLNWSKRQVSKYRQSLYSDLLESGSDEPGESGEFNWGQIELNYIKRNLTPEEKKIFQYSHLPNKDLAVKLGTNVNRANYLKRKLTNKIQSLRQNLNSS